MTKKTKKITIPQSWSDITLGDYEQWSLQKTDDYNQLVDYVCTICKLDRAEIEQYPCEVFNDIVSTIDFVFSPNFAPCDSVFWKGTLYKLNTYEKMPLSEYVDIDAVLKGDNKNYISDTLAIVLRPEDEPYDAQKTYERAQLFRTIPCEKIMPVVAFFLSNTANFDNALSVCSLVMDQANQYLHDLENFVPNGGGIKPYAIYQKIRLMRSTKPLRKALKMCSDSYSINKTKQEQIRTNIISKNR